MSHPVKIHADIDQPDRLLAGMTGRQLALLGGTGLLLYGLWTLTSGLVPTPVYLGLAVPIAAAAAVIALGRRDGIGLDQLLIAAIRHRVAPRRRVAAPEGVRPVPEWITPAEPSARGRRHEEVVSAPLELPATGVTRTGIIDLGSDGLALVASCGPVNFALRTPAEQDALVAALGRWLHSLSAPVQILVRAHRLDLTPQLRELAEGARALPHPALEHAAREHADFVASLAARSDLLRRQILLVLREPVGGATATDGLGGRSVRDQLTVLHRRRSPATQRPDAAAREAAETRLVRRLGEAADLLGAAGITVTALDAGQATAVLAAACDPDTLLPPSAGLAGADEVITTTPADTDHDDQQPTGPSGDVDDPADFQGDEPWD